MSGKCGRTILALAAVVLFSGGGCAARVTVLQNGVSPSPEYAGCADTWISAEPYEGGRDNSGSESLRCGGKRHVLIRFDLSGIPADHVIDRAVLRLADVGYPAKGKDGTWASYLAAYRLSRQWNDKASWEHHTRKSRRDKPADAAWATPGGDIDRATDFGEGPTGLVASGRVADGPWGHVHELDVTSIVSQWHAGRLPNHGFLLAAAPGSRGCTVAGSEWYVPASRPKLIVSHAPKGAEPPAIAPLSPAPKDIELDPISKTPPRGPIIGRVYTVRVGRNSNCHLRGGSTDAYVKEAVGKFPGNWGWMNMCRVGGRAGDFSRALLYFDLKEIPPTAHIASARLVLPLTPWTNRHAGSYRYGAFLLRLADSPGWKAEEVTAAGRRAGAGWPRGGLPGACADKPLAIGKYTTRKVGNRTYPGTMEFDLSGAVRAWVQGKARNCGVVLDNRIEGGAYDFYSSRSFHPELRPYLEIKLFGAGPFPRPLPIEAKPARPPGDYWVGPMREVHKKFKGTPGTLAQYGDSITVTYAFLAYRFAAAAPKDITPPRKELALANTPPQVRKELELVAGYSDRRLWWKWKGAQWGCTGQMRSDWLLANVDAWQRKMNPEVAVILFGTNDLGGICPPEYTENMAASIRRMLADGAVPMLTTVPPASGRAALAGEYDLALWSIARAFKIPVIDYYGEIMRRRPKEWDGRLPELIKAGRYGLISRDGVHPSHPGKYVFDFSEEALNNNGYVLRDYLTIRKYYEVITRVLRPKAD